MTSPRTKVGILGEQIASSFLSDVFPGVAFFQPHTSGHFMDLIGVTEANDVLAFEVKTTLSGRRSFRTSRRSTGHGRQMTSEWVDADPNLQDAGFADADVVCYGVRVDLAAGRVALYRRVTADAKGWEMVVEKDISRNYYPPEHAG